MALGFKSKTQRKELVLYGEMMLRKELNWQKMTNLRENVILLLSAIWRHIQRKLRKNLIKCEKESS